jgi:integrase
MKGTVGFDRKSERYYVAWYHEPLRRTLKLWFYHGDINIPFKKGKQGKELAQRMLDQMRGDYENGVFRIEKFSSKASDVVPYLNAWVEAIRPTLAPSTYKDYKGSIAIHLAPFFTARGVQLHEIQYDILMELLSTIKREGKGKMNVMYCLHACLDYAWRSGRIQVMPPFPKKGVYQIVEPVIRWLPEERQDKVIQAIALDDQPIFWFLKYHLRRPGEAMALRKEDFENGVFKIRHGISNYREINRVKDKQQHPVPMVSAFAPWLEYEMEKQRKHGIISPHIFVSLRGRLQGKRYTEKTLERRWAAACESVGEDITLYSGTKHSRATQLLNVYGLSKSDLKEAGDWSRMESVDKYAKVEVATRKGLLEGKVRRLEVREKEEKDVK